MKKALNKYLELEGVDLARQWFLETGIRKEIKKNSYFFREGDAKHYAGFIESGSFRYLKSNNKSIQDQIVGYSFDNDFVTDYGAFQMQEKAQVSAQAIKDSIVWVVSYEKLNHFYDICELKNLRANLSELLLSDIYGRLLSFYVDSPEERYFNLISRFPEILNLVSLKEIASFIKVTPETLSRIRSKMKML